VFPTYGTAEIFGLDCVLDAREIKEYVGYVPAAPGAWLLQAQPVIFRQFPLAFGPPKQVTVSSNSTPVIVMGLPAVTNHQVLLNFSVSGGVAPSFHLLQTAQLSPPAWTTNSAALLATNTPGSSYQFTVTNNSAVEFYRVQTP
jgi:hypothetical protein